MTYCKAKGEVMEVFKTKSIHPNCYTDITVKITSEDSFSLYKGKLKNKEGEGQKSSSIPYGKLECDNQFYIFYCCCKKYFEIKSFNKNLGKND